MLTLPLLGAVLAFVQEAEAPPPALELLDHARLSAALRTIAGAHPDHARVLKLGDSRGGRAIEALELTGAGAKQDEARPAILLVANLDGARVYSSAVALDHARRLADGYGGDPAVTGLLDGTTVFIVPRANPDAAEARFASPRAEIRASGPGIDDDRDGRQGEDPPADVNGDGVVTWIRVADPDGEWREDAGDARILVKADRVKGERGVYRLWPEGRDADGDEKVAEDALLDARVDRNFPAGWEEHTADGGLFPTDEPEVRALCEFVLQHRALAMVVVYDAQDSLVSEPKSVGDDAPRVKRVPPPGILESDAKLLGELGKRYKKATEGSAKGESETGGTFARWAYEHRGLWTLSAALWEIPLEEKKKDDAKPEGGPAKEGEEKPGEAAGQAPEAPRGEGRPEGRAAAGEGGPRRGGGRGPGGGGGGGGGGGAPAAKADEPKPTDDVKRLKWIDAAGDEEAWRFRPWTAFQHPELGAVEIGGFAPYARLEPPASESGEVAKTHFDWFLTLGEVLPRVSVSECTREALGGGVTRVTAVVQNDAYLPLLSRSARRTDTIRPAKVVLLLPEAGRRLAGDPQELLTDLPGSGGRHEYTWLVQGPAAMEIAVRVETTHAGTSTKTAEEK